MDLDEMVTSDSSYLQKSDVNGEDGINVTIRGVKFEEVGDEKEKKAVLYFQEHEKGMVLNLTNKDRLKHATGEHTTQGIQGKRIGLFNDPTVMFGAKMTGGIRIRKATTDEGTPFDDDIPFT